jgi:hypothetical protein
MGLSQSAHKADGGIPWLPSLRSKLHVHRVFQCSVVGVPAQERLRGGNPSGGGPLLLLNVSRQW